MATDSLRSVKTVDYLSFFFSKMKQQW